VLDDAKAEPANKAPMATAKPARPRTYRFVPETLDRLAEFASARDGKEGEIIRDALQLYDCIYRAQAQAKRRGGGTLAVLLDDGAPIPARMVIPLLNQDRVQVGSEVS
jgi:hypothetical protein